MATYVYETVPSGPRGPERRFEVVQSMREQPLTRHPDTGEPVRRVITGGYGFIRTGEKTAPPSAPCAPGCACHSGPKFPQP